MAFMARLMHVETAVAAAIERLPVSLATGHTQLGHHPGPAGRPETPQRQDRSARNSNPYMSPAGSVCEGPCRPNVQARYLAPDLLAKPTLISTKG